MPRVLAILTRVFRKALVVKVVTSEQRTGGNEGASHVGIWGKNFSGRGKT